MHLTRNSLQHGPECCTIIKYLQERASYSCHSYATVVILRAIPIAYILRDSEEDEAPVRANRQNFAAILVNSQWGRLPWVISIRERACLSRFESAALLRADSQRPRLQFFL